jgi:hypothetical protein
VTDTPIVVNSIWADLEPDWALIPGLPAVQRATTRRIIRVSDVTDEHVYGYSFWQQHTDGQWVGLPGRRGYSTRLKKRIFLRRFEPQDPAEATVALVQEDTRTQVARDIRLFAMTVDLHGLGAEQAMEMAALVAEGRVDTTGVAA